MTVKTILIEPNKILRQISLTVKKVEKEEQILMDDMLETMYDAKGIGLAAIQIGIPKRIIVMDISKDNEKNNPMYFVNPIIKNRNLNLSKYLEGCLSLPDQFAEVDRPSTCEVEYLDYNGNKKILKANGLLSTCIQHEMDHLEGKVFVEYLSKLKRDVVKRKMLKLKTHTDDGVEAAL